MDYGSVATVLAAPCVAAVLLGPVLLSSDSSRRRIRCRIPDLDGIAQSIADTITHAAALRHVRREALFAQVAHKIRRKDAIP